MSHRNHNHKIHVPHTQANASAAPISQTVQADSRDSGSIVDRIRIRAFEISKARNGGPGDERSDWLQAERELRTQNKQET